jgi:hypothetical protein
MAFATWTKGTSALLLTIRALARAEGVEDTLLEEWRTSLPQLGEQSIAAARAALSKGWRWKGEMGADRASQEWTRSRGMGDGDVWDHTDDRPRGRRRRACCEVLCSIPLFLAAKEI